MQRKDATPPENAPVSKIKRADHLTPSGMAPSPLGGLMAGRRQLLLLTTCSDDSKPYMILKALDESYKNHIGFAII